jgi:hypothetical protein
MTKRTDTIQDLASSLARAAVAEGQTIPFHKDRYWVREADWDVFWATFPDADMEEEMRFADDYTYTAEITLNRSCP